MARAVVTSRELEFFCQIHKQWKRTRILRNSRHSSAGWNDWEVPKKYRVIPSQSASHKARAEDSQSLDLRARALGCLREPDMPRRCSKSLYSLWPHRVGSRGRGQERQDPQFHPSAVERHSCRSLCCKDVRLEIPPVKAGEEFYRRKIRHIYNYPTDLRFGIRRSECLESPSLSTELRKPYFRAMITRAPNSSVVSFDLRVVPDSIISSGNFLRGLHFGKGPSSIEIKDDSVVVTPVQGLSQRARKAASEAKLEDPALATEERSANRERDVDEILHLGRADENRRLKDENVVVPPPMGLSRLAKKIKYILGGGSRSWQALAGLGMNLNPSLVSKVLKVVEDFRLAYGFFQWAGEQQGYENTADVYNIMVGKLAANKHVEGAVLLLREMTDKGLKVNVVTYTTVIHALCKAGDMNSALKLFTQMRASDCAPNVYTYNAVLNGLGKLGRVDEALELFADMESKGCPPDVVTFNTLIDTLGRSGKMDHAGQLFKEMEARGCTPDVVTYNSLIHGFGKEGRCSAACSVFQTMKRNRCEHDAVTYSVLMDALAKAQIWDQAFELLEEFQKEGQSKPGAALYTCLIDALCKAKLAKQAFQVFENMQQHGSTPDVYTYTTLLVGLGKSGDWEMVWTLVEDMKRAGFTPNVVTYNSLIDSLGKAGQDEAAWRLFIEMEQRGVSPDVVTYNSLIAGLGKVGRLEEALDFLETMKVRGITPTVVTYTSLVDFHIKAGNIKVVWKLLEEMNLKGLKPNGVTFRALIDGFCKAGELELAWDFFLNMLEMGYTPHLFTYKSLITACHKAGKVDQMQEVFEIVRRGSYGRTAGHLGALKDFLGELKQATDGRQFRKRDVSQQDVSN